MFQPLLININPKTTVADGACGNTTATLKLNDGNSTLIGFTFAVVSNFLYFELIFHLTACMVITYSKIFLLLAGAGLFPYGKWNWTAECLETNGELG